MAKKNGKAAPQVENTTPEVAEESKETKKNNVFLDRVSEKLVRDVQGKDGKDYKSVSFVHHKDEEGKNVMASFLVRPGQVLASTKMGKDGQRVDNPGFNNILVGSPNQKIDVSINEKDADGNYIKVKMEASEIKACNDAARADYKKAQKAEKAAQAKEGIDAPEAAAPEVENEGLEG